MVESLQENNGQELLYILTSLKKMSHLNTGLTKLVYHLLLHSRVVVPIVNQLTII